MSSITLKLLAVLGKTSTMGPLSVTSGRPPADQSVSRLMRLLAPPDHTCVAGAVRSSRNSRIGRYERRRRDEAGFGDKGSHNRQLEDDICKSLVVGPLPIPPW